MESHDDEVKNELLLESQNIKTNPGSPDTNQTIDIPEEENKWEAIGNVVSGMLA